MSQYLTRLYDPDNLPLLTDLYQLTMAQAYWEAGIDKIPSVFEMHYRTPPFKSIPFIVVAGIDIVREWIDNFSFNGKLLTFMRKQGNFDPAFLDAVDGLRMKDCLSVKAVQEGSIAFPATPIVRVNGQHMMGQILESITLNIINFQSLIATKAFLISHAAQGDDVIEMGLRRAQGIDGAVGAARASFIGGNIGTSNVLASELLGIPAIGTHAHSWVMSFPSEEEAFARYIKSRSSHGKGATLLIDTYDFAKGLQVAIKLAKIYPGVVRAFRLDSAVPEEIQKVRQVMNESGVGTVKLILSNDLDEFRIKDIKDACHDTEGTLAFGVGTREVTAHPVGAMNGIYKLTMMSGKPKRKTSVLNPRKATYAGNRQIARFYIAGHSGAHLFDYVYHEIPNVSINPELVAIVNAISNQLETNITFHGPLLSNIHQHTLDSLAVIRSRAHDATDRQLKSPLYSLKQAEAVEKILENKFKASKLKDFVFMNRTLTELNRESNHV